MLPPPPLLLAFRVSSFSFSSLSLSLSLSRSLATPPLSLHMQMKSVTDDSESSDTESNYSEDGEIGCCAKICDALAHCACCGFMRDGISISCITTSVDFSHVLEFKKIILNDL